MCATTELGYIYMKCKLKIYIYKLKNWQLYSLQDWVAGSGVTLLEAEQPWVPRLDCVRPEKVWGEVPAVEPPVKLGCLVPCEWDTNLGGPS